MQQGEHGHLGGVQEDRVPEGRAEADPGYPGVHRAAARAVEQDPRADIVGRPHSRPVAAAQATEEVETLFLDAIASLESIV